MAALFRISTITPIRAPINLASEDLAGFDFETKAPLPLSGEPFDQLFADFGGPAPLDWTYGYGSLANDQCPRFFRPLLKRKLTFGTQQNLKQKVEEFCAKWSLQLVCAEVYIFDDTLGLLRLDFERPQGQTMLDWATDEQRAEFDAETSRLAEFIYHRTLYPGFVSGVAQLDAVDSDQIKIRKQNDFDIFNDVRFCASQPENERYVLWTGRTLFVDPAQLDSATENTLRDWGACPEGTTRDVGLGNAHIGSGNNLVYTSLPLEDAAREWFRGQSICQYYNAILFTYNLILKRILLQIGALEKKGLKKSRRANHLLGSMTKRLDHLNFASLEFGECRRGAQHHRRRIIDQTLEAWELEDVANSALEMAEFARQRLERLQQKRMAQQSRSIELILTAIGGVAVIDLFLSLSEMTWREGLHNDGVPGLLDAFSTLSPDGWISVALIIVIMVTLSVYRGRS